MIIDKMVNIIKDKSTELMQNKNDKIFMIVINQFNDGECIDLGTKIVVSDNDEDNFNELYYSFTLDDNEIKEDVISYIKQDSVAENDNHEWKRQQELVEMLLKALQECDWIDEDAVIEMEEYD